MRLIYFMSMIFVVGCKPPAAQPDSEAKSLDNFAGGQTVNTCRGTEAYAVPPSAILGSSAEQISVREALTSVPSGLQDAFFSGLSGVVVLTSDLSGSCADKSKMLAEPESQAISCWQNVGKDKIAIYIARGADEASTTANIAHATVRSFGYVLSQVMLKVDNTPEGVDLTENPDMDVVKSEVALATLLNVKNGSKYELTAFAVHLGKEIPESTADAELVSIWNELKTTDRGKLFADYVFAESFDSWYCNGQTRSVLQADFDKQYAGVRGVYNQFEEISAELPVAFAQGSQEEMGLWGRWGRGNGPVRNGFARWGNFRSSGRGFFNFRRARAGGGFVFNRGGLGRRWF